MKQFTPKLICIVLFFCATLLSCKKQALPEPSRPLDEKAVARSEKISFLPDFEKLADILAVELNYQIAGYAFVITYKNLTVASRAGGYARLPHENSPRAMSINEKYGIASVSKTISAAALLKALTTLPNTINMIDIPIWPYLPKHWTLGPNVKTITFRQLLNHTSGFRNGANDGNACSYFDLKKLVANGIILSNKTTSYNNRNYALMRLLIPVLAKYDIPSVNVSNNLMLPVAEALQSGKLTAAYKDYCNKVIFKNMPSTSNLTIDCKNTALIPALYYQYPYNSSLGISQGDLSSESGGQGWVLTTAQMADFFRTLNYTENILPKVLTDFMKNELLGYDVKGATADGVGYFYKNGLYVHTSGHRYHSLIIGFNDDVQISIMVNSLIDLKAEAIDAHQYWYN